MKVGITGHQDLGPPDAVWWVSEALSETIEGYEVIEGLTSLAVGADQLFAEILNSKGILYSVVIPCADYEQTFDEEYLVRYKQLLSQSARSLQLDYGEPSEEAFFEAGKRVVELSDVVIAVWNGQPARGVGGTADVVEYAAQRQKKVVHINPVTKKVTEIRDSTESGKETSGH